MAFDFLENAPESVIEVAWKTIQERTSYPNSLYAEVQPPTNDPEQIMIDDSRNLADSQKEDLALAEVSNPSFFDLFPLPLREMKEHM